MKVCVNARVIEGPWGGGNQAIRSIRTRLAQCGVEVVNSLEEGLDCILMVSTDHRLAITSVGLGEIEEYLIRHRECRLIHRINTSGEAHRGFGDEIARTLRANSLADHTVFISRYLQSLFEARGFDTRRPHSVIMNGADRRTFFPSLANGWRPGERLRMVTHHWSPNYAKGFDVYQKLDDLLAGPLSRAVEFTFIGNLSERVSFRSTRVLPALHGEELGAELRKNHVYITASRNEGAGMHHIEGMMSGLPVLFVNSGAVPEYCAGYGLEYDPENIEGAVRAMMAMYASLRARVLGCDFDSDRMSEEYLRTLRDVCGTKGTRSVSARKRAGVLFSNLVRRATRFAVSIKRALSGDRHEIHGGRE